VKEIYVSQHLNAGLVAVEREQARRAVPELERVLKVEPDHPEGRASLGRAYALAERHREALPLLEQLPTQDRTLSDWLFLLKAYDHVGRRGEADSVSAQLVMIARRAWPNPGVLNNIAYVLADQGRNLDDALALASEATSRRPEEGVTVDTLAWVHYRRGDHDLALREINRACRLYPWNAVLHYHRAMILLKCGARDPAVAALGAALELDPDNGEAKAELVRQRGDPEPYIRRGKGWRRHWYRAQRMTLELEDALRRGLSSLSSTA
jgi:tetratricopeptide (TPR) repeat protein